MLSRRGFVACWICAAGGFAAADAGAQTPGLKRTVLTKIDGPIEGYETINAKVEIDAGFAIARHTHPGVESTLVLEGGLTLDIEGKGSLALAPGQAFQVPPSTPHGGKNGDAKSVLSATYIVEKGKPLASPA